MVQVPEHVEAAIFRSLAKDPTERYATAAEFADALAGRKAEPAPPPPAPETGKKKGCAAILLFCAGLGGLAAHLLR
jgi:hypothetical protein